MRGTRTEYQIATDSLKITLKRQKMTYKELARKLKLSESGVKKILSARDGSFQRLAQICKELGFAMSELLRSEHETMYDVSYSSSQQEYLVSTPKALRLYWALVYERRTLQESKKIAALSDRETFSILRKLDLLRLLELLPGDHLRLPPVRPVRWVGGGPLVTKIYQEWSLKLLHAAASSIRKPRESQADERKDSFFLMRYFRASSQTRNELITALRELEAEFTRRAIQDMRSEAPDLGHLRWIAAIDGKSYLD